MPPVIFRAIILVSWNQSSPDKSNVIPGNPRESGGDPESSDFKDFWILVFTGMTTEAPMSFSMNF